MIFEKDFERHGFDTIVAYSSKDIPDNLLEDTFQIGNTFFDAQYQFDRPKLKEVVKSFGNFCFVIYDKAEKKVIGYSFWMPVKTKIFADFLQRKEMLLLMEKEYCSEFTEPVINLFQLGEAFVTGYDLDNIHKALEDIFQGKVLALAKKGTKINYIAIEAVCKYDEEYLVKLLGMTHKLKKDKSTFYCEEYSPNLVYNRSRFVPELKEFYK